MKRSLHYLLLSLLVSPSVFASSISLPIWKEEVEALGYELPKPIGISVGYMTMEQGICVDSIALKGLNLPGLGLEAKNGTQKTDVVTLRADVWLFPFLNIYALFGQIEGYSRVDVDASYTMHVPIFGDKKIEYTIEDFELPLDGTTKGLGMVLAGGQGNWFGLVDASFSQSKLSIIDGEIDALVINPRVGYDFKSYDVPLQLWVGAQYQDVEQRLQGNVADLGLPEIINYLPDMSFDVKQHLTTAWNPLLGFQYEITKSWHLIGEAGFGDRESLFASFDYRF